MSALTVEQAVARLANLNPDWSMSGPQIGEFDEDVAETAQATMSIRRPELNNDAVPRGQVE